MGSRTTTNRIGAFTRRVLLIIAAAIGIIALVVVGVWLGVLLGLWSYVEING